MRRCCCPSRQQKVACLLTYVLLQIAPRALPINNDVPSLAGYEPAGLEAFDTRGGGGRRGPGTKTADCLLSLRSEHGYCCRCCIPKLSSPAFLPSPNHHQTANECILRSNKPAVCRCHKLRRGDVAVRFRICPIHTQSCVVVCVCLWKGRGLAGL